MPTMMPTNRATLAATQLIDILQTPQPNSPFPTVGNKQMQALAKLANIFHNTLQRDPAPMLLAPRVEKEPTQLALPKLDPQQSTVRSPPLHRYPLQFLYRLKNHLSPPQIE